MNIDEFRKWDIGNNYEDFIPVELAKYTGAIPVQFHELFKDKCLCGSDFIISKKLKRCLCMNPKCYIKIGKRMSEMFKNFGGENISEKTCVKIAEHCIKRGFFKVPTHTEILRCYDSTDLNIQLGARYYDLSRNIEMIRKSDMTFPSFISKIGIPQFKTSAEDVLKGIANTKELIDSIKESSITKFCNDRGIKDGKKIMSLYENLQTILIAESSLYKNLVIPSLSEKKICVTGFVNVNKMRYSREEFIQLCNKICRVNNIQLCTISNSTAISSCENVIADYPSSSRKYLLAREREEMGEEGLILTAQEFVDKLREEVKICVQMAEEELMKKSLS